MIDIHCHILPGLDDGPQHEQEALAMGRAADKEGITHIVATPHHRTSKYDNSKDTILAYVNLLNKLFEREQIGVKILPGQETRIYGEMVEGVKQGELLTQNQTGSYLFVEFPAGHVPRYAEQLFYDFQVAGVTPVIVHPERNSDIARNPDILYNLVKNGALAQITAASLTGVMGKKIKKFTQQIVEHNLTHFIASDAHNTTTRPFKLREGYNELCDRFGVGVEFVFKENAELLIEGRMVNRDVPERIKEKRFFGVF
ncbi:protein-tyrosine phosphatase [Scopulibacillus darangshiensis]|uniref:Tyrosine-protein phosphatase n=1 Tax=Scopulibacillus darangshiensis TaxID=442528 RepID=A0A4R2NSV5_9BACL|nr:CpsB/CapC family capsule biosynthesis tyrosine phosphatase [Scopulibacillus darangshiensis]TCP24927.1 protein-tyrosine phosphatase [Scopulibacillus darangshiensis]